MGTSKDLAKPWNAMIEKELFKRMSYEDVYNKLAMEIIRCPTCGQLMMIIEDEMVCLNCGFFREVED